ncbi:MAG TPA: DUF2283 domain-containing protein [Dongiaceae bacterium]|nr:DUF2283 domain-containing protein [Dongiaceae bacterium]
MRARKSLADLNEAGEVLGIEILDVSIPENLELARRFAAERGLEFPAAAGFVPAGEAGTATER